MPRAGAPDAVWTIPNETARLAELADWVMTWTASRGIEGPARTKMRLIVEEIAGNALMHGFPSGESGRVRIEMWDGPAGGPWQMCIADDGPPFDPLASEPPDQSDVPVAERDIGGAGLMLVHSVAERLAYERQDGWNVLDIEIGSGPIG